MLEDEQAMAERIELLEMMDNCVHSTNWKSVLTAKSKMRLITLSIKHAKEFYDSEVIGKETEPYRAIEGYFKRVDWERQMLRGEGPPPLPFLRLYMKPGDRYRSMEASYTKTTTKKSKKAK